MIVQSIESASVFLAQVPKLYFTICSHVCSLSQSIEQHPAIIIFQDREASQMLGFFPKSPKPDRREELGRGRDRNGKSWEHFTIEYDSLCPEKLYKPPRLYESLIARRERTTVRSGVDTWRVKQHSRRFTYRNAENWVKWGARQCNHWLFNLPKWEKTLES